MDWTKQAEDMVATWLESQKKMWETFTASMSAYEKAPSVKMWEEIVAYGEKTLQNTLKTQDEWMQSWIENLSAIEGMPEQGIKSLKQFQEVMEYWITTQKQLWAAWFEMLKGFNQDKFTSKWSEMIHTPFHLWQQTTKKVMESQAEWMRTWIDQFRGETGE